MHKKLFRFTFVGHTVIAGRHVHTTYSGIVSDVSQVEVLERLMPLYAEAYPAIPLIISECNEMNVHAHIDFLEQEGFLDEFCQQLRK